MKLTRSYLKQLVHEMIQKEGMFGDWLDRMRAANEESGAKYREKLAAQEKEKEEEEASGTRIGGSKRKKFAGSEFGKDVEKELREEEEIKDLSERKLPPREDPDLVARWEEIKPSLDQLAEAFEASSTGPHFTMAKDVDTFKNKVEAGMRFASYGERERAETVGHREPVSSFAVNERKRK